MAKFIHFRFHRIFLILTLLISTVGCDQATKRVARDFFQSSHPLSYWGGTVVLQHAQNTGAFLSLGAGMEDVFKFWIFSVAVGLFLAIALFFLIGKQQLDALSTFALSLIVGGGIGNLIDRLTIGSVTDFIFIGVGPIRTGVFNVADVAITTGVLIFTFVSFKQREINQTDKVRVKN